jgi:hypothetical protein
MEGLFTNSEDHIGAETKVGDYQVKPISRASFLLSEFLPIGLGWYRPVAVEVKKGDEPATTLLVRDPTRLMQVVLYGIAAFALIGILLAGRER